MTNASDREDNEGLKFDEVSGEIVVKTKVLETVGGDGLLALQLDEAASSLTYIGEASPGSATSSAVWRIKRIDESGNPEIIIKWADGNTNFDNVWDNRAALSYS